jgi:TRAP-type C4-dicarboxylate transport system permease small subunit
MNGQCWFGGVGTQALRLIQALLLKESFSRRAEEAPTFGRGSSLVTFLNQGILMKFKKVIDFVGIAASVSAKIANTIAAAFLFILMLFVCSDVILRYFFHKPILGSFELTEVMMAILVGLSLAYCALQKGHVRVDLVVSMLPERAQAIMNSIAHFAFLGLFVLITWRIIPRAMQMKEVDQVTLILRIPVFPFVLVVAAGTAVLCLVLLKDLLGDLYKVAKK